MTTAPRLIRELADEMDRLAQINIPIKPSCALRWADRIRSLAAEPVGKRMGRCKEKNQPGGCQLHNLHCGYPKCDEFPDEQPDSAEAGGTFCPACEQVVTEPCSSADCATPELRATDDGKGGRSCCDDALPGHSLDCPERFQPKANGGDAEVERLISEAGGEWRDSTYVIEASDLFAFVRKLSAAPQPEQATLPIPSHVYITDKGAIVAGIPQSGWNEESTEAHNCDANGCGQCHVLYRLDFTDERTQPEQPARTDILDMLRDKAAEVRANGQKFGLRSLHDAADALIEARRMLMDNKQPARDGVEPFGYYFKDLAGAQHFHKGARIPLFAQSEITPLFAQPPQQADGGLELVASAFNYLGDFPAIDEAWVTNWRNRAEAFLSQQADGGAVAWWLDSRSESVISAELKQANPQYTDWDIPLYAAPPKSPGVGVDRAMVNRALDAQPFANVNIATRVWQTIDHPDAPKIMRAALLAALGGEK